MRHAWVGLAAVLLAVTAVAQGPIAPVDPLDDWRGRPDLAGRELTATEIGIADELAAAADLARDKTSRTPAVKVEGLARFVRPDDGPGCSGQLRPPDEDLFR